MKRLFVGIPLPEVLYSRLEEFYRDLKETEGYFRFVSVENLHLTLSFLGDVEEDQVSGVVEKIKLALSKQTKIPIKLVGAGCFPNEERINVIWVGIQGGVLIDVIKKVNSCLSVKTEHEEEIAHMTIARVKSVKYRGRIREVVERFERVDFGSFIADRVFLYESELEPEGPIYTIVEKFELL